MTWLESLDEYVTLPRGWDSYGADPITKEAVESAKFVGRILVELGLPEPWAAPVATGGVQLEWPADGEGDSYFEIEIRPDGGLESLLVRRNGSPREYREWHGKP